MRETRFFSACFVGTLVWLALLCVVNAACQLGTPKQAVHKAVALPDLPQLEKKPRLLRPPLPNAIPRRLFAASLSEATLSEAKALVSSTGHGGLCISVGAERASLVALWRDCDQVFVADSNPNAFWYHRVISALIQASRPDSDDTRGWMTAFQSLRETQDPLLWSAATQPAFGALSSVEADNMYWWWWYSVNSDIAAQTYFPLLNSPADADQHPGVRYFTIPSTFRPLAELHAEGAFRSVFLKWDLWNTTPDSPRLSPADLAGALVQAGDSIEPLAILDVSWVFTLPFHMPSGVDRFVRDTKPVLDTFQPLLQASIARAVEPLLLVSIRSRQNPDRFDTAALNLGTLPSAPDAVEACLRSFAIHMQSASSSDLGTPFRCRPTGC